MSIKSMATKMVSGRCMDGTNPLEESLARPSLPSKAIRVTLSAKDPAADKDADPEEVE